MTQERLSKILDLVYSKYKNRILSPLLVQSFYNDVSAVIKGLHRTEHFLNVYVDSQAKIILCKDTESLTFIGVLPYLENKLMRDDSLYFVYLLVEGSVYLQCAIKIKDLYKENCGSLGFDAEVYPITPLGVYYTDSNIFRRWR